MRSEAIFLVALALCASHAASAPTAAEATVNVELDGLPIREESADVPRLIAHLPSLLREPGCSSASSSPSSSLSSSSTCASCTSGRFQLLVYSEHLVRVRESFMLAEHNCSLLLVRRVDREQIAELLAPCFPNQSPPSPSGAAASSSAAAAPQCLLLKIRDVRDRANPRTLTLRIRVEDINDNAPRWKEQSAIEFSEQDEVGRWRPLEGAVDRDAGRNGAMSYRLVSVSPTADLKLEERNGVLGVKVARPLDRERYDRYELVIEARDGGDPLQSATATVQVNIRDSNDNDPKFERSLYEFNVSEEMSNVQIGRVLATDTDAELAGSVTYEIPSMPTSGAGAADAAGRYPFLIVPDSGELWLMRPLDFETRAVHEFQVVARDMHGNEGARSASALVRVHVLDANDCEPRIMLDYSNEAHVERVDENLPADTFVSTFSVSDCDAGDNGNFSCSLANNADDFRIAPDAEQPRVGGGVGSAQTQTSRTRSFKLLTRRPLDSEVHANYLLEIRCTDRGREPRVGAAALELVVHNLNDNPPVFAERDRYKFRVPENAPLGSLVGQVFASDPDGAFAESLRYSLNATWLESVPSARERRSPLCVPIASARSARAASALTPSCLHIDPQTGRITLQCALDRESLASFSVLAIANDSGSIEHGAPALSATVRVDIEIVDVNEQPPRFENSHYQFVVVENDNDPRERLVGQVMAYDCDESTDSAVRYQLSPRQDGRIDQPLPFRVDEKGAIYTRGAIDRERESEYAFDVVAVDGHGVGGQEYLSASAAVLVRVEDVNDNAPVWQPGHQTTFRVAQPRRPNEELRDVQVEARDPDALDNAAVVYSLEETRESLSSSSGLRMNAATGVLSWVGPVPPQRMGPYRVTVVASDSGRPPQRSAGLQLVIDFEPLPLAPSQNFRPQQSNSHSNQQQAYSSQYRFSERENSAGDVGGPQPDWLSASVNEIAIACLALILAVLVCLFVLLLVWLRWRAHYLAAANAGGSDPADGPLSAHNANPANGKPLAVHAISIANGGTTRRSCPISTPNKALFSPRSDAGRVSAKGSSGGSWRSAAAAQWPAKCGGGEHIGIPMSVAAMAMASCDENANATGDCVGVASPLLLERTQSGRPASARSGSRPPQPEPVEVGGAPEEEAELEVEDCGEGADADEGSEDEFGFTTTRGRKRQRGRGPSASHGYGAPCSAPRHSIDSQSQSCADCEQCRREREATTIPSMPTLPQELQEQISHSSSSSDRNNYDLPASSDPTLSREGTDVMSPNSHPIYRPIAYKPPAAGSGTLMVSNGHGSSAQVQRHGKFLSGAGTGPGAAGLGVMALPMNTMGPVDQLMGTGMDVGVGIGGLSAASAWNGHMQSLQLLAAGHQLALYSGQQPSRPPTAAAFPALTGPTAPDDRTTATDTPGRRGNVWTSQWLAAHTQSKPIIEGSFV